MSDEEKEAFSRDVNNEMIWKMCEGNPATESNIGNKDGKPFIIKIEPELAEQNGLDPSTIDNSERQEPIPSD
jgi:hypothetical protein